MFKKALIGGVLPPIFVLATGCERREVGKTAETSVPVARVNGKTLYKRDFETYLPEEARSALTLSEERAYLDRWIATELLYEAAVSSGMRVTPEIATRLEQFKKDLVSDRLVQKVIREQAVVKEEETRAYYEAHIDEYTRELRVSHILVNSPEEVEKVRELLKSQTFNWVETRHSIDKHTGRGGDLGFLSKGNMIPEFEAVVFKMKVGEVSEVVESELGYHFLKITDAREARNKLAFEDVAEDITRVLLLKKRADVYDNLVRDLIAKATIEILDPELRAIMETDPDSISAEGGGVQQ